METLGVTGQRPYSNRVDGPQRKFGFDKTHAGVAYFAGQGITRLVSGLAPGAEQWAAAAAIINKMELHAALPFPGEHEAARWSKDEKEHYFSLLDAVPQANVHVYGPRPPAGPEVLAAYHGRNQWLVDNVTHLLIATNGARKGGTWDVIERAIVRDLRGAVIHTARQKVQMFADGAELAALFGLEHQVEAVA